MNPGDRRGRKQAGRPPEEVTEARDREAWLLRVRDQMDYRAIASALDTTLQTAYAAVQRERLRIAHTDRALAIKEDHTERLEAAAYDCWKEWERSKHPADMARDVTKKLGTKDK